jgi:hypothetical protein
VGDGDTAHNEPNVSVYFNMRCAIVSNFKGIEITLTIFEWDEMG